jgi:hypothetical protein
LSYQYGIAAGSRRKGCGISVSRLKKYTDAFLIH